MFVVSVVILKYIYKKTQKKRGWSKTANTQQILENVSAILRSSLMLG